MLVHLLGAFRIVVYESLQVQYQNRGEFLEEVLLYGVSIVAFGW